MTLFGVNCIGKGDPCTFWAALNTTVSYPVNLAAKEIWATWVQLPVMSLLSVSSSPLPLKHFQWVGKERMLQLTWSQWCWCLRPLSCDLFLVAFLVAPKIRISLRRRHKKLFTCSNASIDISTVCWRLSSWFSSPCSSSLPTSSTSTFPIPLSRGNLELLQ